MRKLTTFLFLLVSFNVFSQIDLIKTAANLTDEGKYLYQLEMVAWDGTDIFYDSFKEPERIGGYFSFMDANKPKCLFFSKGERPRVIGVVTFGDIGIVETATIDFKERDFKNYEKELFTIRAKALAEVQQDTLFKAYNNTNLNLIPTMRNGVKKVYALTAPKVTGVVLFGNDYLLTFDKNNNLIDKERLHRNLIPIAFEDDKEAVASVHSHAPGTNEFITPTDICTLMLYAKYAGWKQHMVISQNYVSIWDCENNSLGIMTREDFEKMKEIE
ncbi:hypothetical protein JGH11_09385 [Dysgonomonas sp. Marseille-P4677]|uniref:hypothetical protein n=1 Tax=Dysgonomonas sp. Marseille-P4677 TaxID=2364790 RepID=UPI0019146FB8|nr:hypothetical protein [Dysgonomonas sp. Marseille-P4677]MBK5721080.1 hypothetical protein [Dysgonomonas sp. Marseille-P4677]